MSMSFEELATMWLDNVGVVVMKPSGFKSYAGIIENHLLPAFANRSLETLTTAAVQQYVAERVKSGLSERTVANHVQVMRRLMKYATESGYVESNPVVSVSSPRQEPASARLRYLASDQLRVLIENTPRAWRILIATACMTGLRKGELLALRFSDIDFEKRAISVSRTIRAGVVTSPKTPWSTGVIPLPESLVALLEERRGQVSNPEGLVFCRRGGSPLPDSLPNRILRKALEEAGLPQVTWHEMGRHSWVVAHLQAGTDIPTLTRLGRWKSADVLLSTYAHVLPASGGDAVRRLDELMTNK